MTPTGWLGLLFTLLDSINSTSDTVRTLNTCFVTVKLKFESRHCCITRVARRQWRYRLPVEAASRLVHSPPSVPARRVVPIMTVDSRPSQLFTQSVFFLKRMAISYDIFTVIHLFPTGAIYGFPWISRCTHYADRLSNFSVN